MIKKTNQIADKQMLCLSQTVVYVFVFEQHLSTLFHQYTTNFIVNNKINLTYYIINFSSKITDFTHSESYSKFDIVFLW